MFFNSGTSRILGGSSGLVFGRVSTFTIFTSATIFGNSCLTSIVSEDESEGTGGFTTSLVRSSNSTNSGSIVLSANLTTGLNDVGSGTLMSSVSLEAGVTAVLSGISSGSNARGTAFATACSSLASNGDATLSGGFKY